MSLAGCSARGDSTRSQSPTLSEHYGTKAVTYDHPQIQLTGPTPPVALGETVEFTLTNTSDSRVNLGCGNPWTLHRHTKGHWQDIIRTSADGFPLCLSSVSPGETRTEEVTLKRPDLEHSATRQGAETIREELRPGRYRFVLLATEPYTAVEFEVRSTV